MPESLQYLNAMNEWRGGGELNIYETLSKKQFQTLRNQLMSCMQKQVKENWYNIR